MPRTHRCAEDRPRLDRSGADRPLIRRLSALAAAALLTTALPAGADPDRGRLLYENHCRACHESNAHIRDDRRAGDRAELMAWVVRWSQHLGLDWRAAERTDVVDYLNQRYYGY